MQRRTTLTSLSLSLVLASATMGCDDGGDEGTDEAATESGDTTGAGTDAGTEAGTTDAGSETAGDTAGDTAADTTGDTTGDTTDTTGGGAFCDTDPGWGPLTVGAPVKHITGFDHTGAEFNSCELYGTPVIFDIAAVWCGPCNDVSNYLANGGSDPFGGGLGDQLSTRINAGTIKWVTTLVQDANSGPATVDNAAQWDGMYHNANIPVVVGDGDIQMLPNYFMLGCWPSAFVADHEMNWMGFDDCMTWNQLVAVVNAYP